MARPHGSDLIARIDHLIYGTPDLDATLEELEERFGIGASKGGRHPGEGTHNALYSLGPHVYLEIMAPDPGQPDPDRPRWLGIDDLDQPRLLTWVAKGTELQSLVTEAAGNGVHLGPALAGSRRQSDGSEIHWHVTDPHVMIAGGVVPFFIDWRETIHPSRTAAQGLTLIGLRGEHPDPGATRKKLAALDLDLQVAQAPVPGLVAMIESPRGVIELR